MILDSSCQESGPNVFSLAHLRACCAAGDAVEIPYDRARDPKQSCVYIESTIPSYVVARPARDLLQAARQQLTLPVLCTPDELTGELYE